MTISGGNRSVCRVWQPADRPRFHHLRWCEFCRLTMKAIIHLRPNVIIDIGYIQIKLM